MDIAKCNLFLRNLTKSNCLIWTTLELENPFTLKELEMALKALRKGKAPGLDGVLFSFLGSGWIFDKL